MFGTSLSEFLDFEINLKKLKYLSKILFDINVTVSSAKMDYCGCTLETRNIFMSYNHIYQETNVALLMFNNIDNIGTSFLLLCFFHELSHLLTMNHDDEILWLNLRNSISTEKEYRQISYEKLADNLGYAIIIQNKEIINAVFDFNIIKILKYWFNRKTIVNNNMNLVREYKLKYLGENNVHNR